MGKVLFKKKNYTCLVLLFIAQALVTGCASVGELKPTIVLDEVKLGDNNSEFTILSDLSQWSPSAGSLVLAYKISQLTVDRGFRYYYMDQISRGDEMDTRPSFRVTFYRTLPEGMSVANPKTAVVYHGDWVNGYENGRGTLIWPDGSRYEGKWVESKPAGFGVKIWPNGDRYEGNWRNGKRHGKGTMTWAIGAHYEGDWREGSEHGQGRMRYPNGVSYEGDWANGSETGHGVFTMANGDRHEGDFIDGSGTSSEGVFITRFDIGILYWEHRSGEAITGEQLRKKVARIVSDSMKSAAIDAMGYIGLCDEVLDKIDTQGRAYHKK